MSDHDDEQQPDPAVRRRAQAEGAARDLARMGIDPRSLGLGDAPPQPTPVARGGDATGDDNSSVLPLRPEFAPGNGNASAEEPAAPARPESLAPAAPTPVAPTPPPAPGAPREVSRLVRQVARGIATPDAADAMQDERALVEAVRARQSDRRVVALVSGKGGVGCTTVGVALGTWLVAMRDDHTVLVDVQQGTPSLGELVGAGSPRSASSLLTETEVVDPPRSAAGLGVVDGAAFDQGLSRADVSGVLERLGSEHTFNLLDVGNDAGEGAHAALARADQVVLVTGPGAIGAAALATARERVRLVNPMAAGRAVQVVVCPHQDAHRATRREIGSGPIIVVPPEPALAAGEMFDPARVGAGTREALLRVAAAVAQGAPRHG